MESSFVIRLLSVILIAEFPPFCLTCSGDVYCNDTKLMATNKSLRKRSVLTFPPDSVLQINMGITLAGHLQRNNAIVVLAFQQNSPLPNEAQPLLFPSLVVTGRQFSIYDHLKNVIASYGFNGTECFRKMVCQARETPLVGGLLEDVVAFVLSCRFGCSPSRHRGIEAASKEGEVAMLLEAERLGANGGDCAKAFPQCIRTPLDFISTFTRK